jgi:CheY-like chemotaxis protein
VARYRDFESTYLRDNRQQQMNNLEVQLEHALSDSTTPAAADATTTVATAAADATEQAAVEAGSSQASGKTEKDDQQPAEPKALPRSGLYRLPIVGMSANSDNESRLMGLASGMDDFIAKPFSMKDLEAMLNNLYPRSE